MAWRKTRWDDESIEPEGFLGGTRVRLTYPDGNVVVGKLTVAPDLRPSRGITMVRITTPHTGDTYMDAAPADVEVWETDAFPTKDDAAHPG